MDVTASSPPSAPEHSTVSTENDSLPDPSTAKHHHGPAHALTPPTSEDMNNKLGDDSSDLSELELDDEEEEEDIEPDHYWGDGRVPVFKPTMHQFRDFKKFIDKIDKYGMKSGIVKVIAPQEWRDNQPALDELVKGIKIKNPITQEFMGTHGIYTQANMEKQRSYNLPEWKALTDEPQNQPPARRGERRRNQEQMARGAAAKTRASSSRTSTPKDPTAKRGPGRPRKNPLPKEAVSTEKEPMSGEDLTKVGQVPPTPTSPVIKSTEASDHPTPSKPKPKPRGRPPRNGQQKSVSSRRMNNITEKNDVVDEAAFENFDYHMENLEEFTPERCAELETAYWKSLTFAQPMYAADMPGSLFTEDCNTWNVAKLPNLLDVLGTKVPGVNTAYLYMGMWKATFAWHLEDVDLYSINYIHFGAPKQWYSISQEDARKFEKAMKSVWPNDSKACDQFLRHKTYLISPEILQKQFGIKVNKLVHHEGEFVITYPYGYHSGYNLGYNCAESVNFATEGWLDFGRIAKKCNCEADSVWVDVGEIERKLRGEPTPEYYEETDDDDEDDLEMDATTDLPSPPASVAGKPKAQTQPRKRKRDPKDKDAGKKKKRIRILIRAPSKEPCVLCPNDVPNEPLLPTDNGQKAHRCCALYTPETWITTEDGVEEIHGVTSIDKARLELKCNFCRSKRGACFQCAAKKCTRAFHATCALAAGVQVDCGPVPTFGEDGTEYYEEGFDLRCRFHRPKRAKNLDVDALEHSRLINTFAKALQPGDAIQAQYPNGDIFAGLVVENRVGENSVLIDILPSGDRVEVEWKWIVVLDPIDSLRPKPSAKAIPMPEGMNKKSVSIENRQDGVPLMETTFHEDPAYKWAEFINLQCPPQGYSTMAVIKNPEQVKIDMNKPDHLYYYLPTKSTEAKGRFTDDPKGKNPTSRADFMDRVKPPKIPRPVTATAATAATAVTPYASAYGNPRMQQQNNRPTFSERPYTYKPKTPAFPSSGYNIDPRALANQQQFMQQAERRSSYSNMLPYHAQQIPPLRQQNSDPVRHSPAPLRPFPGDAYYSSRILPAAMPGEYSHFSEQVRRNSGVDHRPSLGMLQQGQPYGQQGSPPGQLPGFNSGSPGSSMMGQIQDQPQDRVGGVRRESLSSSYGPPNYGTPTGGNHASNQAQHGGSSGSPYMRGNNHTTPPQVKEEYPGSGTTAPPPGNGARLSNVAWTPPSKVYHAYDNGHISPQQTQTQPANRLQPTYQTPQEFQQQLGEQARQPNVANRYGAYDRMLRDMAHNQTLPPLNNPYGSAANIGNGAPQGFYTPSANQNTFPSPKAPTPSPLSDVQTPRAPSPGLAQPVPWGMPPNAQRQPLTSLPSLQSLTQGGPFAASPPPQQ